MFTELDPDFELFLIGQLVQVGKVSMADHLMLIVAEAEKDH